MTEIAMGPKPCPFCGGMPQNLRENLLVNRPAWLEHWCSRGVDGQQVTITVRAETVPMCVALWNKRDE